MPLARIAFNLFWLALFAAAVIYALPLPLKAHRVPLVFAISGAALTLALMAVDSWRLLRRSKVQALPPSKMQKAAPAGEHQVVIAVLAWVAGLTLAIWLLGVLYAVPLFLFTYLTFKSRLHWLVAVAHALSALLVLYLGIYKGLEVLLPPGALLRLFT